MMASTAYNLTKNVSNDRILVLAKIEGTETLDAAGKVDNRLFSGKNRLHAIKDPQTNFWRLQYDSGILSQSLKQEWTSFTRLMSFVEEYFKRRGIEIKEIIDA